MFIKIRYVVYVAACTLYLISLREVTDAVVN